MRIVLAMLAGVSLMACLVAGCAGVEKRPGLYELVTGATSKGTELTCVTFSVAGDAAEDGPQAWALREAFVAEVIAAQRADVVALQRVSLAQASAIAQRLGGMKVIAGEGSGVGVALLVRDARWALASEQRIDQGPGKAASLVLATLRGRGDEKAIDVIALDLTGAGEEERTKLGSRVAKALGEGTIPALVMGGFGSGEGSAGVVAIRAMGYIDAWRLMYPDALEGGTEHGFTGKHDGPRVDGILVPKGSLVLNAATIGVSRSGRYPSDHFPVAAQVKLMDRN